MRFILLFSLLSLCQGAKVLTLRGTLKQATDIASQLLGLLDPLKLLSGTQKFPFQDSTLHQLIPKIDYLGNIHIRFDQYYQGVRVVGHQILVHHRKAFQAPFVPPKGKWGTEVTVQEAVEEGFGGFFSAVESFVDKVKPFKPDNWFPQIETYISGSFIVDLAGDLGKIDTTIYNVIEKLVEVKNQALGSGFRVLDNPLHDVAELVIFLDPNDLMKAKLAYKVGFLAQKNDTKNYERPYRYIDVSTGKTLVEFDSLFSQQIVEMGTGPGGNEKIGKYTFGMDKAKLMVAKDGNTCSFDTPLLKTMDLEGSNDIYKTEDPVTFPCFEQKGDQANGAYSPLNDAHYYATETLRMYAQWFGPKKPDIPVPLLVKAHLGQWNGFFDGRQVVLGDYKNGRYPSATVDVVSHEIGHIVTYYSSKLEYQGVSGALNEAFSDWAGKALEYFLNKKVDGWKIGKGVIRSGYPDALRCLDNPTCDGKSVDHVSKFTNGMKVHHSSGIFNKAFHHMATKFKYEAWDMLDVLYQANQYYWQEHEDFAGVAEATILAAEDLKNGAQNAGSYWLETKDLVDGFRLVGITCKKVSGGWKCKI